jgi:hypothetical protein
MRSRLGVYEDYAADAADSQSWVGSGWHSIGGTTQVLDISSIALDSMTTDNRSGFDVSCELLDLCADLDHQIAVSKGRIAMGCMDLQHSVMNGYAKFDMLCEVHPMLSLVMRSLLYGPGLEPLLWRP